jgi:hypothetical protein
MDYPEIAKEFEGLSEEECFAKGLTAKLVKKYGCTPKTATNYRARYLNSGIIAGAKAIGVEVKNVKAGWGKTPDFSGYFTNSFYDPDNIQDVVSAFEDVLLRYESKVFKKVPIIKQEFEKQLIVTTTDEHVGMNTNPGNTGLFGFEYTPEIFKQSYDKVFDVICQKYDLHRGAFDVLTIENLGDEQDGWNGFTTRGGHSLPQNASNFDVAEAVMDAKIGLIHKCIDAGIAKKIIVRKVGNDNHSGDFGKVVNLGVKKAINATYKSDIVEVDILHKFIEQRFWGIHCFLLTHGKDEKDMKRGLPFQLNDGAINFINNYIKFYDLNSRFNCIHVDKGDLHQLGMVVKTDFIYNNFMSFAPPSNWSQHNYANDSPAGFTCRVIHKKDTQEDRTNHYFDYKKYIA